ncbi:MAG: GNAT family N-acetyltransferase [Oscillospiraceae bacterium]|jgi:tagatose 1,6-diphosphate aldolase|nr:GNAT family N-acetyltransferase [Oscillospiraceae bacterium]
MFDFLEEFDTLAGTDITLRIREKYLGDADLPPYYYYNIFENATDRAVGKISVRIGDNDQIYYNGHIGYEIEEPYRGRGYATEACRMVLRVAQAHGMTRCYITCARSNAQSRRVAEKLGARLLDITPIPRSCFFWHDGIEDYCVFERTI